MISYPSTSPEVDKLIPLLIDARHEIKSIGKDLGPNGTARFKYASIEKIIEEVEPILFKHKLFLTFNEVRFDDGIFALETKIFECSGQFIRTTARVNDPLYFQNPKKDAEQIYGGVLTYCKRYGVANLLGLQIGENDPDDVQPSTTKLDNQDEPQKPFVIKEDGTPITPNQLNTLQNKFKNSAVQQKYPTEFKKLAELTKAEASQLIGKLI